MPAYAQFLSSLWRVNVVTDGITVQKIYLSVANASHRTDAVPTKNALASSFISRRLVPLVRSRLGFQHFTQCMTSTNTNYASQTSQEKHSDYSSW